MRFFALIGLLALTLSCKDQEINKQYTIDEGQTEKIMTDGKATLLVGKIQNSLCPPNAYCIRAGEGVVDMVASQNGQSVSFRLCTGPDCQTTQKGKPSQTVINVGGRVWTIQLATVIGPTAPQRAVVNVQIQ